MLSHHQPGRFQNPWNTWEVRHVKSSRAATSSCSNIVSMNTIQSQERVLGDVLKWQLDRGRKGLSSGAWLLDGSKDFQAAFPVHQLDPEVLRSPPGTFHGCPLPMRTVHR